MHEKVAKSILSAKNGMNIYRGCSHGCIYCDARSTCYQMQHDFEDIEVKVNAPQLLEETLKRKRKKCMIGTGAMSDPYLHLENSLHLTRECLKVIDRYGFGVAIQTKSDRILQDLDLLKSINKKARCVVQMTLTTYDEDLCKIIEPNVCTTRRRIETLKIMRDAGIETVIWMTPILPFINDTKENIENILQVCIDIQIKALMFFDIGVTLRDGDRQYFYKKLDQYFPGMKERYIRTYGNAYELGSPNRKELYQLVVDTCKKHDIIYKSEEVFRYLNYFEEKEKQLSLSDFL